MQVMMHTGGLASTNCYVIGDETTKKAVLFDAPDHTVAPLLDKVQQLGWDLVGLWLTHGHFDHIADHKVVTDRFPKAKVLIHPLDHPKLQKPGSAMFALPFEIPPRNADELVEDGTKLLMGSLKCEVIHTPGHSPGHVCYHFPTENLLIGGDLIICGAVGRTDLPDADSHALDASIKRILQLPGNTHLLPGHCNPSTLADELMGNEYVRMVIENGGER